ncbi:hypothetical protein FisN_13Lu369 [Fistulifera solaris]|uniref:Uncharacterized protein n=1 Tax=Fistulifera solaris TaxID=1519565 RepID=A0A1Z5KLF0_FISSO|nr:hypothetical protein FisN_13Lu369 [Fistulifera solaris]|eukprot:GAX27106.1 hypothetical protein FisN_13Lu369 [Fistulifera solaris]
MRYSTTLCLGETRKFSLSLSLVASRPLVVVAECDENVRHVELSDMRARVCAIGPVARTRRQNDIDNRQSA